MMIMVTTAIAMTTARMMMIFMITMMMTRTCVMAKLRYMFRFKRQVGEDAFKYNERTSTRIKTWFAAFEYQFIQRSLC